MPRGIELRRPLLARRRLPGFDLRVLGRAAHLHQADVEGPRQADEQAPERPAEVQEGRRAREAAAGTNCVATTQTSLDALLTDARDSIAAACPQTATDALQFGGACDQFSYDAAAVAACSTCAADRAADELILVQHGTPAK